jgi:hypothetical protein
VISWNLLKPNLQIVPFESAVLNLPGERETQLRINADHENMCRFDTSLESDRDNYRKVERNLLMLCADALVPPVEQGKGGKMKKVQNSTPGCVEKRLFH